MASLRILPVLAATLLSLCDVAAGQPAPAVRSAEPPSERLSIQFIRLAGTLTAQETLTVEAIETAVLLTREAIGLSPDDVETWRFAHEIAVLAEDEALEEEALKNIVRLDPRDDRARLLRFTRALDAYDTAEARIAATERLLDPAVRDRVGDRVASRLALDVALLHQRRGDTAAFLEALTRAVTFDPANRRAAAIAAGVHNARSVDPVGHAELLINLLLADPTDVVTQIELARLLLTHGAFEGAARFYGIATQSQAEMRQVPTDELIADYAVARWANGDLAGAIDLVDMRQGYANQQLHSRLLVDEPDLDPLQRGERRVLLAPALTTLRAAILVLGRDPTREAAVARALESHRGFLDGDARAPADEREKALRRIDMASAALWLGGPEEAVDALLEEAARFQPLSDTLEARFAGLRRLRAGDAAGAVEVLRPVAAADALSALGLAEAFRELGQRKDAATTYLELVRRTPGTMIGAWCSTRLEQLLGERVAIDATARALEDLAGTVPRVVDRFASQPSLAIELKVLPSAQRFGPYDPVTITIEISNRAPFPLALDRDGPIKPQLILWLSSSAGYGNRAGNVAPVVLEFDRRLALDARETLHIPFDLRRTALGRVLYGTIRQGSFLRVRAMLNFLVTPAGAVIPSLLGAEAWSDTIRIDGVDVDADWMRDTAARVRDSSRPIDLVELAMLNDMSVFELREDAPPALFQLMDEMRQVVPEAYVRLDPTSQAWLLGTTAATRLLNEIRADARISTDRHVQMMYLLKHALRADDPAVLRLLDDDDLDLRRLATRIQDGLANRTTQLLPGSIPSR